MEEAATAAGDSIMPLHQADWRDEGMMRPLKPRILVALFVLLAGISQAFAAQDKSAAEKTEKKDTQNTDASKKVAPDSPDPDEIRLGKPAVHEFVIANFKTEGGVTLPQVKVVYGTYGHLNVARDNVVLVPSHYMADHRGYEFLIGSDRALDPAKIFVVATELFGNGHSSSPSNTPEPFHGPRFPVMT